jgi:hypothetical protein
MKVRQNVICQVFYHLAYLSLTPAKVQAHMLHSDLAQSFQLSDQAIRTGLGAEAETPHWGIWIFIQI